MIFWWKSDDRSETGPVKGAQKWCFHVIPTSFLAVPKFWAIFFASYITISASLSVKSWSSSSSQWLSAYPSLLLNPQLHLPQFSCAIHVTLKTLWSVPHHLPQWLTAFRKQCHWWNGCQRRVILEACKVAMFFRRTVSRFGQHNSNFFWKGRIYFFDGFWQYSLRSIQKRLFQDFIDFLWACAKNLDLFFWQIFTFGKSAHTIWKIYSIPAYSDGFQTFQRSLPVSINGSITLLTLVVCNFILHVNILSAETTIYVG